MESNVVFNAAVCLIGLVIFLVHIVNVLFKKNRRKDENALLVFFAFTAFHFALYLTFTLLKSFLQIRSDAYIMAFYTIFFISNNLEVFLFFIYMLWYVDIEKKLRRPLFIANFSLCVLFIALDLANIFTHMFFYSEGGVYTRAKTMMLAQIYQFVMLGTSFILTIALKKLNIREKIAFGLYCVLPLISIILQNIFKGYAIAYLSIIVAIEILFLFLSVEKTIMLSKEEEEKKEAQIRVMLSQIQPHFVYNALSSISTLIPIEPEKAQRALDDFTEYLRLNLASLTETHLIPFEDELRHIKTFVALSELRFPGRIEMVYDLETTDFYIPPLSIQPLVENAVKHGILKKMKGGKIIIKAYEKDSSFIVKVIDDGVGFDMEQVDFESNKHFGLQNISYRISKISGGKLSIESKPGVGTTATASFPIQGRLS